MKHMKSMTNRVPKTAVNGVGTYMVLAGQIIAILADLFADKEVLGPATDAEGEAE